VLPKILTTAEAYSLYSQSKHRFASALSQEGASAKIQKVINFIKTVRSSVSNGQSAFNG
jgi:predicted nucleic-acid-binding protein